MHAFSLTPRLLTAVGLAMGLMTSVSSAATWPSQPLKLVVGFAPGGGNDTLARILAKELQQDLGQTVIVENRAGAGGMIANEYVAQAPKDGYTLLLGSIGQNTIAPLLSQKQTFDPRKDLQPVSLVADSGNALLVNAKLPYRNTKDLLEAARKAPGQINYASSGVGSTLHLAGALFAYQSKVTMAHIPYRGNSQAITDVAAGQVEVIFSGIPPAIASSKTGKTRILAVTTPQRSKALPDVPTIAESGIPGYAFNSWYGLFVTGGTDPAITQRLAKQVQLIMQRPAVQEQFAEQGVIPTSSSPESFTKQIDDELKHWKQNLKAMNITAE